MTKALLIFISLIFLAATTACKETIVVDNNTIPQEYIEEAKKYTGEYTGQIGVNKINLSLTIENSKANLEIVSKDNSEIISNCITSIGSNPKISVSNLKYLVIDDSAETLVSEMGFKLNHNCLNLAGNKVVLVPSIYLDSYNIYITKKEWSSINCPDNRKVRPDSEVYGFKSSDTSLLKLTSANIEDPNIPDIPETKICKSYLEGYVKRK